MEQSLLEKLKGSGQLPTPPAVVVRFLELSNNPDVSIGDVVDVLALDPALSAKVLRFANSPIAGVGRKVSSLQQAVALLGLRSVKMMALSFSLIDSHQATSCPSFDRRQHALQSLACGVTARKLAVVFQTGAPQEAFLAGLLSQIGRSALACALPDEYEVILQNAAQVPRDLPRLEHAALQGTYATLGAELLRQWNIPESICGAIGSFRPLDGSAPKTPLDRLLFTAELAASIVCPSNQADSIDPIYFVEFLQKNYELELEACRELLGKVSEEISEARILFDLGDAHMIHADELTARVRERITELSVAMHLENVGLSRERDELFKRATTDPLTGIGNRASFDACFSQELERSVRHSRPLTLLIVDLDHFKKFNDNYGHLAGDRVLQAAARVLDDNIRKIDFVARYGGEEFAIIAPETSQEGAIYLAERICEQMCALVVDWEGTRLCITASVGGAVCLDPIDPNNGAMLIQAADEQLYVAKRSGRNCAKLRTLTSLSRGSDSVKPPEPRPIGTR